MAFDLDDDELKTTREMYKTKYFERKAKNERRRINKSN